MLIFWAVRHNKYKVIGVSVGVIFVQIVTFENYYVFYWRSHRPHQSEGHTVAQLVEALRYKQEGRGFDSRWRHWNYSLIKSFRQHYGPGVDSASNRNTSWG